MVAIHAEGDLFTRSVSGLRLQAQPVAGVARLRDSDMRRPENSGVSSYDVFYCRLSLRESSVTLGNAIATGTTDDSKCVL